MAATDMPTTSALLTRGCRKKPYTRLRKGIEATFLILGGALDNRTAIGKDYAVELWRDYHGGQFDGIAALQSQVFLTEYFDERSCVASRYVSGSGDISDASDDLRSRCANCNFITNPNLMSSLCNPSI